LLSRSWKGKKPDTGQISAEPKQARSKKLCHANFGFMMCYIEKKILTLTESGLDPL